MENDVQLLQQLLTLGDTIQELRRNQQKPKLAKTHSNCSTSSASSVSEANEANDLEIKKINKLESEESVIDNNELEVEIQNFKIISF